MAPIIQRHALCVAFAIGVSPVTATADATGQAAQQQFDLSTSTQVVTDRRGNRTVYTFDADGNITEVLNALGERTTFKFDANGNETEVTNALGQTTKRTFVAETGKQLTETNALDKTQSTAYPEVGTTWQRLNPVSSTDARGNVTNYTYGDYNRDLTKPGAVPSLITEPLGRTTAIGVNNNNGNLNSLNIAGEVTTYQYDAQGRRTRETNGLGHSTTYAYDANGNETRRTVTRTVNGQVQSFTTTRVYDAENRLIEETDPLGGKRVSSYTSTGKLASQTDSLGRITRYVYDANSRLIRTEHPDGTVETVAYDAEGNETSRTDRAGRTTRMDYDALNRLSRTTHPDGSGESTQYDAAGRVKTTTDRNGQTTTFEYDAAGRQTASVDATGRRTSQTFDENGNRTSQTIGQGVDARTTTFTYDALNRLTRTTWADGSTHSSVYRPDNRKQSETDARGVTTTYGYDAAGRLTSVTQTGTSGNTTYGYDETAAKTTQTDALGRQTQWTLDGNGRITSRQIQDGTKETSQYDIEGNRLQRTTFAGETLSFQYDNSNRVTNQLVPQGAGSNSAIAPATIAFSYATSGQLLSQHEQGATTLNGSQSYRYDANDRLTQLANPIGQIGYGLDANGQIVERSLTAGSTSAGTARYSYDAAGRLQTVIAPDGKQARYGYDGAGRLVTTERELNAKDGQTQTLVTHQRYDQADRGVSIAHVLKAGSGETVVAGQSLTRSTGGAITKIDTFTAGGYDSATGQFGGAPSRTQVFEYDGNARLTKETTTQGGTSAETAYEYDAVGNRTKKTQTTGAGAEITAYAYDAADRITSETTTLPAGGSKVTTYSWDQNGNLQSKTEPGKTTLYRFDPQNRLIDVRTGSSLSDAQAATPSVSYAYDVQGNRVRQTTAQGSTGFLIDTTHTYAQVAVQTRGNETTAYTWGAGLLRQTKVNGAATEDLLPMPGHLGTSLGAIDITGNVVERVAADAFGNLENSSGLKQNHIYTGEYWDQDSQLVYLRARWYEPRIGRFISADPFEGYQDDARSLNRYAYANSDPVHVVDPSGLFGLITTSVSGVSANTTYRSAEAKRAGHSILSFRGQICRGIHAVGSALPRHHVLPRGVGGRSDFKPDVVQPLDAGVHHQIHKLMSLAFVMNGFPGTSNTDREIFRKIFADPKTGTRDRIRARRIVLDVTKYVDTACTGVRGYVALTPKLKSVLRSGAFDF